MRGMLLTESRMDCIYFLEHALIEYVSKNVTHAEH
jgi:hypothetical protein